MANRQPSRGARRAGTFARGHGRSQARSLVSKGVSGPAPNNGTRRRNGWVAASRVAVWSGWWKAHIWSSSDTATVTLAPKTTSRRRPKCGIRSCRSGRAAAGRAPSADARPAVASGESRNRPRRSGISCATWVVRTICVRRGQGGALDAVRPPQRNDHGLRRPGHSATSGRAYSGWPFLVDGCAAIRTACCPMSVRRTDGVRYVPNAISRSRHVGARASSPLADPGGVLERGCLRAAGLVPPPSGHRRAGAIGLPGPR